MRGIAQIVRPMSALVIGAVLMFGSIDVQPTGISVHIAKAHASGDRCYRTLWPSHYSGIELKACETESGTSGYTVLTNNTDTTYDLCWTMHYARGHSDKGCHFKLKPGDQWRAGCPYCVRMGSGGLIDVDWTSIKASD